jgi:hypothetical protein
MSIAGAGFGSGSAAGRRLGAGRFFVCDSDSMGNRQSVSNKAMIEMCFKKNPPGKTRAMLIQSATRVESIKHFCRLGMRICSIAPTPAASGGPCQ